MHRHLRRSVAAAVLAFAGAVQAAPAVLSISMLQEFNGSSPIPQDINNAGVVVGYVLINVDNVPLMWRDGVPQGLQIPQLQDGTASVYATAINESGLVAGTAGSQLGQETPILWAPSGAPTLLPTGGASLQATGINESGQISTANFETGVVQHAINDHGVTVGQQGYLWPYLPYMWSADGHATELPRLGSGAAWATDINNQGLIVGTERGPSDFQSRAVYWKDGQVFDLGSLDGDSRGYSYALRVNELGQVIGGSSGSARTRPFLWQDGMMYDLNALDGVEGTGWTFDQVFALNDVGQIVGSGSLNGVNRSFVLQLTPVPEPSTWLLPGLGLALAACVAHRRRGPPMR